ncbi:MAG: dihydropyrimidinase [Candidatus Sumerlaeota bacterium]|nr:dihydropyrimidinase [Candidatus Sumerlaeota bacterium]
MDLVIRNASIVTDGLEMNADLGIANGVVTQIGRLEKVPAANVIDAAGKVILPGLVDVGVSLYCENEYTLDSGQSLDALTAEALAGGITTVVLAEPFDEGRILTEELAERRTADAALARTDFGYHYLLRDWSPERERHVRTAASAGIASVWVARCPIEAEHPGTALLHAVAQDLPESTLLLTRPSEACLEYHLRRTLRAKGFVQPAYHSQTFPSWLEESAVHLLGAIARGSRPRLLVLGISSTPALAAIQSLREQGVSILGGATLPHLVRTADMLEEDAGTILPLTCPPLRERADQQSLWNALDSGTLSVVSSGHHPVTTDEARAGHTDALASADGAGGIAGLLPLLHAEGIAKWRLSIESLSLCACADPAKLAGLYPRKGSLQIGSDADFVLLNPRAAGTVDRFTSDSRLADPYSGMECADVVEAVYLRGRCVHGAGADTAVRGRYLDRRLSLA